MIFWPSSEDQNSPRGNPFKVWKMQLPLPEKLEMIRCAWAKGCRTCSSPQKSIESASTLSNEKIGWIMIFWPSSEDQKLPQGNTFQVRQMQLPLPEKWEMIRYPWGLGCRTCSGPQTSNESGSKFLKKPLMNYDILIVLRGPKLTSGWPFPGLTNDSPSQKNGKWLDELEAMAVGCDLAPRHPMRVY